MIFSSSSLCKNVPPVAESTHEQTDDELTDKEAKQMEADDQAIQTILMGLLEDIYADVDSCETAQEIWLRVEQMMKVQLSSVSPRSPITDYLHATSTTQQQLQPTTIIQPELHATTMPNPEDISDPTTAMNMALMIGGHGGNQVGQYVGQIARNQNGYNANGNVVASRAEGNANGNNGNHIRCYNCRGIGLLDGNCTVRPRRRDAAYLQTQLLIAQKEEAGIQLQAKEFNLMVAARDIDEIEDVNENYILMANLQEASTSGIQIGKAPVYDSDDTSKGGTKWGNKATKFVRDFKSLAKEADDSLDKIKVLEIENERLLREVVSQDIMSIVQNNSAVDTFDL
ncbi:hypothetical protein Tco_0691302 [Tanacetum coccineum]